MTTTATAPALPALHLGHSHGLDDTVGYDLVATQQVGSRVELFVFGTEEDLTEALAAVRETRRTGDVTYAYTLPRYADGCREIAYTARQGGCDLVMDHGA